MYVSLFIPCTVDALLTDIGEATVKLLAFLGFDLDCYAGCIGNA